MPITVTPLSPALGAAITGVDLSRPLDPETVAAIHAAWLSHLVLVFPGQQLSEQNQVDFTAHFGPLGQRKRRDAIAEAGLVSHPGVMLITNIRKDGKPIGSLPDGEMMFHSDGAYSADRPYIATFLYALEVPRHGGDTLFANLYAAYDALPDDLKRQLAGRNGIQAYYANTTHKEKAVGSLSGTAEKPLFKVHEETGRTALFVSRLMTVGISGMTEAESAPILERLFDHTERPEFIFRHVWTPGDLVVWDNRCTNHARTDFPAGERRLMRRTTVEPRSAAARATA